MDVDGYIGLYSIQNGNEQLIECLRSEVDADIQLNHRVLKVGKTDSGRYQLNMMNGKGPETRDFDLVLMCLPHSWLATMRWDGEELRKSMVKHVALFRPAGALLEGFDPVRRAVLGREDPRQPGSCRRRSAAAASTTRARYDVGKHGRAQLADRRLGRARVCQSQRPGTDRRPAIKSLPAGLVRQRPRSFRRGRQDPPLAVFSQWRLPGGLAGARRHDQPSGRSRRSIRGSSWSATICSIRR